MKQIYLLKYVLYIYMSLRKQLNLNFCFFFIFKVAFNRKSRKIQRRHTKPTSPRKAENAMMK